MKGNGSLRRWIAIRAALVLLLVPPTNAMGTQVSHGPPWIHVGVGVAPSPYGRDANGSVMASIGARLAVSRRASLSAGARYGNFSTAERVAMVPITVALRLHLSGVPEIEGGPYIEAGPGLCIARWSRQREGHAALLPTAVVGIGTELPVSATVRLDWCGTYTMMSGTRTSWSGSATGEKHRAGMSGGAMYLSIMIRP